ncbi:ComEC/Rec2 family competence protein [Pseudomonas sp. EA_65y_Pfl2_P78]|uniref:ComEC/Rec2 family competence protein n=1 Tax=Pseudomonas sp. EA_65y_Pfl2_P78 TaxID=3088695 RepID=UPI0030DAFD7D
MMKLTALPALYGDCLWLEYGAETDPSVILIDAGLSAPEPLKSRLQQLAAKGGHLELVVVTHVDRDHIGGMLTLLQNDFYGVPVRDVWFNGFRHLPAPEGLEAFGEKQGERLTNLLLEKKTPWNVEQKNGGIFVSPDHCPTFELPGGSRITLLSPDTDQLKRLRANWVKVCGEADLYADMLAQTEFFGKEGLEAFGPVTLDINAMASQIFLEDSSEANGSSIAFIFEYKGKRILFGADAYPSRILQSLRQIAGPPPYKFDLVKVPHHGSENNVSRELIESLECQKYLISSNGSIYKHPSKPAVSRIIKYSTKPLLLFNYRSPHSEMWDNPILKSLFKYSTDYGVDGEITTPV